ncbi:MAG: hypothetical protein LBC31_10400, partial [Treponema sp.]|nr:hypothetical protein [Treponema sp.]
WENERERAAAVKRRATEQKELAKAKYPKKTAALIVFQKAAAAAPTPLEGTYVLKDNPDLLKQGITEQAYTFTGQSWVLIMTKNFTDRELKMQNMLRKVLKEPPLTESTGYPGMRGTVELDGNTLTMVYLQMSGEGSYWLSNPGNVQMKVAFEYSFDSEGNLLLSYKGQAPLTYVRKN